MWVTIMLVGLAVVGVVVLGLVVTGRETARLSAQARPAVFDLEEAVGFIGERLADDVAGRLTPTDVRWILQADADSLEAATADADIIELGPEYLDEDAALARVLSVADDEDRGLDDADIAAVLAERSAYLEAIGAVGPQADRPD